MLRKSNLPITHSNVNFMRLEIEMEVEKYEEEEQSTTPIEPHGFYTTGERLSNPLKDLGEQLNISINVQGICSTTADRVSCVGK